MNNRICGYNCEHNKGGVCQITMCDKQIYITTKTDESLQKQLEKFTGYKIQKDENFEIRKIYELQKEIERLEGIIKSLIGYLESEIHGYEALGYTQSKIREKNLWMAGGYDEDKLILDKLKELKENK